MKKHLPFQKKCNTRVYTIKARRKLPRYVTFILAFFFNVCFITPNVFAQTTYTWNGVTSAWDSPINWLPNIGSPGESDNVIINGGGISQPILNAALNINNLTVSDGTLDLNTFTLTLSGTPTFSGGNVNNGTLSIVSGGTCTFGSTTFGASISGSAVSVLFNGAIFNNTFTFDKTGAANDNGSGNTTFNGTTTISNSGPGYLLLANITSDIFNTDITF
ncbi:MAG: hypothetical protein M3352_08160, partial [Bacteroidota bacterium]|nr:hypothetical protein [Bacteroidota bacterium]